MTVEVKLDSAAIQEVVHSAIMDAIGGEQREAIISQAVKALITPERSQYGGAKPSTPLQEAFDRAVVASANEVAREIVAADPRVRAKITELIGEALVVMDVASFSDSLGHALSAALRKEYS